MNYQDVQLCWRRFFNSRTETNRSLSVNDICVDITWQYFLYIINNTNLHSVGAFPFVLPVPPWGFSQFFEPGLHGFNVFLFCLGVDDDDDDDVLWVGWSIHKISPPCLGNCSHSMRSGHWKPYWVMMGSQPSLALLHRSRQGGSGLEYSGKQIGAYMEQRKNFRSEEHLISTKGQNWCTSRPASSWDSWFSSLGIRVILYPIPMHMGMVISSHFSSESKEEEMTEEELGGASSAAASNVNAIVAIVFSQWLSSWLLQTANFYLNTYFPGRKTRSDFWRYRCMAIWNQKESVNDDK